MSLQNLILVALAASPSTAFFLMPCWPITTQRLDPIVSPGGIASHVHQIIGGSAFSPSMTFEDTQADDVCTTCFVSVDHSNYWIPSLYFQNSDGQFESVDQVGSTSVYYFNEAARLGPNETMNPFPKGFRMLAGDQDKRKGSDDFADQAINYKCLNYAGTPTDSKGFPDYDCPDGIRAEVTFPSCWDGVNLDSDDHRSHVAYPTVTYQAGECPSTHPVHLVTLLVEYIWDTHKFAGRWPTADKNPFVWSTGDPTGFGLHADFFMGWDLDVFSAAVEQCDDEFGVLENCAPFANLLPPTSQTYVNPGTCVANSYIDEDVSGTLSALPGCNPVDANESSSSNCIGSASFNTSWGEWSYSYSSSSSSSSSSGSAWSYSYTYSYGGADATSAAAAVAAEATPVAVDTSVRAGEYGHAESAYSSEETEPLTQSAAGAFYGAAVSVEELSSSPSPSPAPAPASSSPGSSPAAPTDPAGAGAGGDTSQSPSASPAAPTPATLVNVGADGRHTVTVWDIDTVTVTVTDAEAAAAIATGGGGSYPVEDVDDDESALIRRELQSHRMKRHGRRNGAVLF